jgi:hypothetical protein
METFVLRIWVPADAADTSSSDLHGVVEHVSSGRNRRFMGSTELVAFIEDACAAATRALNSEERNYS